MDRGEQTADITSNCVHELFERQARINPTALAVTEGNRCLSYGELDTRSNSNELAQHLSSAGVGPEVVVGLCSPSSIAMVVSALAILKAGGAYLPLDPSHPTQRLSSILNEAGVPVLISAAWMTQSLSGDWRTVTINELGMAATDKRPTGNSDRARRVTPKDLAYVIYTSGSTGEPKGVEVTHENLLNMVWWHQEAFSVVFGEKQVGFLGLFISYTAEQNFVDGVQTRIDRHLKQLKQMGPKAKLQQSRSNLASKAQSLLWRTAYQMLGHRLPRSSRLFQNVPEMNLQAAKRYSPKSYSGRMTVFLSGPVPPEFQLDPHSHLDGMHAADIHLRPVPRRSPFDVSGAARRRPG